jgi:hypothetical protein
MARWQTESMRAFVGNYSAVRGSVIEFCPAHMGFIVPAQPTLRASPPLGDAWLHEVKFNGWRVQIAALVQGHGPYAQANYQ